MALTNIEEALERSVYHLLRSNVVAEGFIPDISNYDVENANIAIAQTAQNNYDQAKTSILNTKGFAVEVYNYSPGQSKGHLNTPRIVIDSEGLLPGDIGLDTTPKFEKTEAGWEKRISVSQTSDFYFNVRLLASNTRQIRTLHGLTMGILPTRGYIKWYDKDFQPHGNLFVRYVSFGEAAMEAEGIVEKIYRFEIPDAHQIDDRIDSIVPPITSIQLDVESQIVRAILNDQYQMVDGEIVITTTEGTELFITNEQFEKHKQSITDHPNIKLGGGIIM